MYRRNKIFVFVSIILIWNNKIENISSLDCWMKTAGAELVIPSGASGAIDTGISVACASSGDTCKRTVIQTAGFAAYPTVKYHCVVVASDTTETAAALSCKSGITVFNTDGTASSACSSYPCTRTLTVTSTGTKLTTHCSQTTDGNKDLPTTCYVGTFSTSATATATTNTNQFCVNTYSASTSGASLTVTGSKADTCTTSATVQCCGTTNCNNVLNCYVGQYNTITTTTQSTFVKAVCALSENSYCKNVYSYSSSTGVTITGSCASSCTAAAVTTTSTSATGTTCSSTAYGNALSTGPTNKFNYIITMPILLITLIFKF